MEQFEQILLKYNCPLREIKSKISIAEIEESIKFVLPFDYKFFIQTYLGFEKEIGCEFIRLWDIDEILETNKNYCIFDNLTNTLGIGSNGGGELIAIEMNGTARVILTPFIDLNKQYHIEIGTSFSDFLFRLDSQQKWFN